VGTGRTDLLPDVIEACRVVGAALAADGHGLIVGGWPGVDYVVAASFAQELASRGEESGLRLTQVVPQGRHPDYPGGQLLQVPPGVAEYTTGLRLAGAVLLIGGLGGTLETAQLAWEMGKPVLPLPLTGGDAHRAFFLTLDDWDRRRPCGVSPEEFRTLAEPLGADARHLRRLLGTVLNAAG
jgi:hypothetical protein